MEKKFSSITENPLIFLYIFNQFLSLPLPWPTQPTRRRRRGVQLLRPLPGAHYHHKPHLYPKPQSQSQTLPPPSSASSYPNPNPNPYPAAAAAAAAAAEPYALNPYAVYEAPPAAAAAAVSQGYVAPAPPPGQPPPPGTAEAGGGAGSAYYYGAVGGDAAAAAAAGLAYYYGAPNSYYAPSDCCGAWQNCACNADNVSQRNMAVNNWIFQWNYCDNLTLHLSPILGQPISTPANQERFTKTHQEESQEAPHTPAFCEVCKVDCNSADVLKTHKQGRKHKKNLQKLQESITPKPVVQAPTTTVASSQETLDANQGNTVTLGQQTKKKKKKAAATAASAEELELKKRRVLTGGAAEENVKVCTVCNVVANNQKVFDYHIAGQKHAAMVKKQQERERQTAPVS
uniref:U1-type domain-containing protein n=1 Tax=Ananas comosus var. bracteatus TaxID=296719 RepID=A0A6V7NVK1_ANACO|nr:unnamed protein product [Ananas comosus var. bracteatus]